MREYAIRSILSGIVLLFLLSLVIFVLLRILPGDPAVAILIQRTGDERGIDQSKLEKIREDLGLNRPLHVQYFDWMWDFFHWDLGKSTTFGRPVKAELAARFQVSLQITLLGAFIMGFFSVILGTLAAVKQGTPWDVGIRMFAVLGIALPSFLTATLTVFIIAVYFHKWPFGYTVALWEDPWTSFSSLIWPAIGMSVFTTAVLLRLVRNTMLEVLREDYMRTARAKGLKERVVTIRHGLRNTLAPNLTFYTLHVIDLIAGSVIIESIFNIQGMGAGVLFALQGRDYVYVQATLLIVGILVITINVLTDIAYGFFDPRVRLA